MTTGRSIVKKAMQKAGILTKNEPLPADEAADGLDVLNGMLSSWSNLTSMAFVRPQESFPVSAGVATYTIGAGGTFNTVRPIQVVSAFYRVGTSDYPISDILDTDYDQFTYEKDVQGYPSRLLFQRSYPLASITLYPVPSEGGSLFIRSEKPLTSVSLDVDVAFPDGWEHALIYNLAVLLAPEYGQEVADSVAKEAARAKDRLAIASARAKSRITPPLTGGNQFNVLTGRYQ